MTTFEEHLKKELEDPEFHWLWEHRDPTDAVSDIVLRRRMELGMSREELAERAGLTERRLRYLEASEADLRLSEVRRLLDVLGIGLRITYDAIPDYVSSSEPAQPPSEREPVRATG